MRLALSCYCCGSTRFKETPQPYYRIEKSFYILHEDVGRAEVICERCGLEDYVANLVVKYEV